ncbi:hypothetical protein [Williamsia sp.]|uniref:hypothetical protein n=1 Tax=Williamsia sp. TaxID=1872085 RepID=UPI001A19AE3E|nr:hypothetical protein [Williamsia sp.]MBJ7291334.1 hypothetical protein [Williamsia sp.]
MFTALETRTDENSDDTEATAEYVRRLRLALAALHADPLSIDAARDVSALL